MKKKIKKMHIKRWKYNYRPRDIAQNAFIEFLNKFDKHIKEVLQRIMKTVVIVSASLTKFAQAMGEIYEEMEHKEMEVCSYNQSEEVNQNVSGNNKRRIAD